MNISDIKIRRVIFNNVVLTAIVLVCVHLCTFGATADVVVYRHGPYSLALCSDSTYVWSDNNKVLAEGTYSRNGTDLYLYSPAETEYEIKYIPRKWKAAVLSVYNRALQSDIPSEAYIQTAGGDMAVRKSDASNLIVINPDERVLGIDAGLYYDMTQAVFKPGHDNVITISGESKYPEYHWTIEDDYVFRKIWQGSLAVPQYYEFELESENRIKLGRLSHLDLGYRVMRLNDSRNAGALRVVKDSFDIPFEAYIQRADGRDTIIKKSDDNNLIALVASERVIGFKVDNRYYKIRRNTIVPEVDNIVIIEETDGKPRDNVSEAAFSMQNFDSTVGDTIVYKSISEKLEFYPDGRFLWQSRERLGVQGDSVPYYFARGIYRKGSDNIVLEAEGKDVYEVIHLKNDKGMTRLITMKDGYNTVGNAYAINNSGDTIKIKSLDKAFGRYIIDDNVRLVGLNVGVGGAYYDLSGADIQRGYTNVVILSGEMSFPRYRWTIDGDTIYHTGMHPSDTNPERFELHLEKGK